MITKSLDSELAIEPHPDDADFLIELRRLAFLAADRFKIPLRSLAHKAMPLGGVGDALCYESKQFIRIVLRYKHRGQWAKNPIIRKGVIENLGWFMPTLLKKEAYKQNKPRIYMKTMRKNVTEFLLANYRENCVFIDYDEIENPVI